MLVVKVMNNKYLNIYDRRRRKNYEAEAECTHDCSTCSANCSSKPKKPAFTPVNQYSKVDKLILLDIYPAREEPIPGVTSKIIFDKVTGPEKVMMAKEELMDYLMNEEIDALITFGAGNIDRFIRPIREMLTSRQATKE